MTVILVWAALLALLVLLFLRCLASFGVKGKALAPFVSEDTMPQPDAPPLKTWKIFLLSLGFRGLLLAAGMVGVMVFSDGPLSFGDCFRQLCLRWDASHYVNLVEQGYRGYMENGQHLFLVFFPGFVWAVRLLRLVIPDTLAAGVLLSSLCAAGACCYVYKLGCLCCSQKAARDSLLYLCLFPFSFFSGLMMTEGLFLFSTAGACYYAKKGKWLPYALFGIASALTRMTGLLVILPAVIFLLEREKPLAKPVPQSLKSCWKKLLSRLPLTLSPVLGTGAYLLLNYLVDGDPFAFSAHQAHWYQGFLPMPSVIDYVKDYFFGNLNNSLGWSVWFPALFLFVAFLALLFWGVFRRENDTGLLIYAAASFVSTYSLSWLLSAGRYLSGCFALFLLLGKLTEKRPALRTALLTAEAVFLGVYFCGYVSGSQIM